MPARRSKRFGDADRKTCRRRKWTLLTLAAAGLPALQPGAYADDTWDNSSGNALWSMASNWVSNVEPDSSDDLLFPLGLPGGDIIINLSAGELCQSLTINDGYVLSGGSGNESSDFV